MLQVIEEIEDIEIGTVNSGIDQVGTMKEDFVVYAQLGKRTRTFYGLIIKSNSSIKKIWFRDIDRMKKILEKMGGDKL